MTPGQNVKRYIAGALEPPTSGTVTLDGRNPYTLSEKDLAAFRNRSVGFLFQDQPLGWPILGEEATVTAFTPRALRDYSGRRYRADAMTLVSSGPSQRPSGFPSA